MTATSAHESAGQRDHQRRRQAAPSTTAGAMPQVTNSRARSCAALDRCPGVARREHGGGVGAEADDLVPPRGERRRGRPRSTRRRPAPARRHPPRTAHPRAPPAAVAPAPRTSEPPEEHDREDQPAHQALLEPAGGHRARTGRDGQPRRAAVERAHDEQPRDRHQRRTEHLALRGPAPRAPGRPAARPSRPWPPVPVRAPVEPGGQQVHRDHEGRGQDAAPAAGARCRRAARRSSGTPRAAPAAGPPSSCPYRLSAAG